MSVKVVVNKFDGGKAEDPRTIAQDQNINSYNYDITANPHMLIPYSDMVAETYDSGAITDVDITDVVPVDISGTINLIGYGRESGASTKSSFFKKSSTSDITSAWTKVATSAGSDTPIAGTLVEYKGKAFAVNSVPNLVRYDPASTFTQVGTILGGALAAYTPKPFVHPDDQILYFGNANVLASYDGTTFDGNVLVLPTDRIITSLTNYGGYLAIATISANGQGRSIVYLWGRDTSLTTVQGLIDWGDNNLLILENINEVLVGVSITKNVGSYTTVERFTLNIATYSGGDVQPVKEYLTNGGTLLALKSFKARQNNTLIFGFDTDNAVFMFKKNKEGNFICSKGRFINPTGSFISSTLNGLSIVGDILFTAYADGGTSGYLARASTTYDVECIYETTINPNMPVGDRAVDKVLMGVRVAFKAGESDSTMKLRVAVDGGSYADALSKTVELTGEYYDESTNLVDTSSLPTGKEFTFQLVSTDYAQIKSLEYIYEKISSTVP